MDMKVTTPQMVPPRSVRRATGPHKGEGGVGGGKTRTPTAPHSSASQGPYMSSVSMPLRGAPRSPSCPAHLT